MRAGSDAVSSSVPITAAILSFIALRVASVWFTAILYHREQATGNRQQGTGNREQATGNRQQGTGNRGEGKGREGEKQAVLARFFLGIGNIRANLAVYKPGIMDVHSPGFELSMSVTLNLFQGLWMLKRVQHDVVLTE